MGIFTVPVKLLRQFPHGDGAPTMVELMVDTGATFTIVPSDLLTRLGVEPIEEREILTADRRSLRRCLGYVGMEVASRRVLSPVLFGEPGDFPVLGAVTLEIAGLVVDPEHKQLSPRPSLLLGH